MIRVLREAVPRAWGGPERHEKGSEGPERSVQVEQEEYDEVVAIKPMFLLWDYE